MSERFIPYAERADKWIKENENRILTTGFTSCFNAKTVLINENGEGMLIKEEIFDIFVGEKIEYYSGLRMLFKAMSENRLFTWDRDPMFDSKPKKIHEYKIFEHEGTILRRYKVPPLYNLDNLIRDYLSQDIGVNIDFDELEMWLLSDQDDIDEITE